MTGLRRTTWHGTVQESRELLAAITEYCACAVTSAGVRRGTCPGHSMLVQDQRALDGLLFVRRSLRERLRREEWRAFNEPYYFTPTQRAAATIDEFLTACEAEPAVAAAHLRLGYFEPWLRDIGRPDLADLSVCLRGGDVEQFLAAADGRY